jgi:hypothetical protein
MCTSWQVAGCLPYQKGKKKKKKKKRCMRVLVFIVLAQYLFFTIVVEGSWMSVKKSFDALSW